MDLDNALAAELEELAPLLKVCGHPLRLKILCAIEKNQEPCVSELWTCLEQSQPVISQHLSVLKKAGVVSSRVQGNRRIYTVDNPFIRSLLRSILRR